MLHVINKTITLSTKGATYVHKLINNNNYYVASVVVSEYITTEPKALSLIKVKATPHFNNIIERLYNNVYVCF